MLGHNGVMVKEALAFFAPYFVKAGFAVLAIDYRTVGASDGELRGQDYPERQVEDFRSAVSYLRTRPEVQPERIGVWDGWRYLDRLLGRAGVHALRDSLDEDWQRRYEGGQSARVPHLTPTPLLMIANGGWDPYHMLEEAQSAFDKAGEPKRLEVLPHDVLGLYTGPGLEEAMAFAIDWFDLYLRRTRLADITPTPTFESVAAMTP
ncbi:alpha/beta hydrolase [Nonomuraea guangzhouensis]|uniref:Alpha/beta hydrolase n=1 Tax=Nonomuraea guangzhouensis TaxID=1291555 RepID=A0ABW4GNM5_9ACTN|nr:hypothetical protein [Nonomuraea guangzhouensis]